MGIGTRANTKTPEARRRWTPREDAALRTGWLVLTAVRLLSALPGRTWTAIYRRAMGLRLPFGVPQGCVGLTSPAAARLAGYDPHRVAAIARWAGLPLGRMYPTPRRADAPPPAVARRYVEVDALRAAVARWDAARGETVSGAARSRELPAETLRKLLLRAGVALPGLRGGGRRIPTAVVDRVVAEAGEVVTAFARARGVSVVRLRAALARAGHRPPPRGRGWWRLPREVLARALATLSRAPGTETVREAARRHAVHPSTLVGVLRRAGVLGPAGPRGVAARVPDAAVDRVVDAWRAGARRAA